MSEKDANLMTPGKAFVPMTQGGQGSGNFGHEGRPGEVGGSGKGGDSGQGEKAPSPGRTKEGGYTETPEGREAYRQDQFERKEKEHEAAVRRQEKEDAEAAKVPEPANAMSDEERAEYWGKDQNATSYLSKALEDANIRGLQVQEIHGVLGRVKAKLIEEGKVKMNFDVKIPFHYKNARREDIPRSVEKVREEAEYIWSVISPRSKS